MKSQPHKQHIWFISIRELTLIKKLIYTEPLKKNMNF